MNYDEIEATHLKWLTDRRDCDRYRFLRQKISEIENIKHFNSRITIHKNRSIGENINM